MALINWSDDLSVGIAEIDDQHKVLIGYINELNAAMKVGKAKQSVGRIIDDLVSYTVTHFTTEEKYFDQFSYPEAAAHKLEHGAFVAQASEFQQDFKDNKILLSVDVMKFLKDWLINHIKGTDKQYTQFFLDHGIK